MIAKTTPAAVVPALDRNTALELARTEYDAILPVLRDLRPDEWRLPTDCAGWDVRAMVAHLVGSAEDGARLRAYFRRKRQRARRFPGMDGLAAHNECQIADHASVPDTDLPVLLERFAPLALKARSRMPSLARRIALATGDPQFPRLTLGYLADLVFTRDVWMHRLDICRATGRLFEVSDHDRAIATHVVRDIGLTWRAPAVALELTGPLAGTWTLGHGVPTGTVRTDGLDYMRTVAGRNDAPVIEGDAPDDVKRAVIAARLCF